MASGAPAPVGRERRQFRHARLPAARSGAAAISTGRSPTLTSIGLDRTDAGHIASSDGDAAGSGSRLGGYDVRAAGNAVNLEDEMIKVAANQMDYQAATTLYTEPRA